MEKTFFFVVIKSELILCFSKRILERTRKIQTNRVGLEIDFKPIIFNLYPHDNRCLALLRLNESYHQLTKTVPERTTATVDKRRVIAIVLCGLFLPCIYNTPLQITGYHTDIHFSRHI